MECFRCSSSVTAHRVGGECWQAPQRVTKRRGGRSALPIGQPSAAATVVHGRPSRCVVWHKLTGLSLRQFNRAEDWQLAPPR